MGYFDSRARLTPVLRQQRDRDALRAALADGTLDALVSDHTPVDADAKALPFAEAEPGATGLELLWSLALKWAQDDKVDVARALATVTAGPAKVLGTSLADLQGSVGHLAIGAVADVVLLSAQGHWPVTEECLRSQGKSTPFSGYELPGRVLSTLVAGHVVFEAA
jgi:dihydroorotase